MGRSSSTLRHVTTRLGGGTCPSSRRSWRASLRATPMFQPCAPRPPSPPLLICLAALMQPSLPQTLKASNGGDDSEGGGASANGDGPGPALTGLANTGTCLNTLCIFLCRRRRPWLGARSRLLTSQGHFRGRHSSKPGFVGSAADPFSARVFEKKCAADRFILHKARSLDFCRVRSGFYALPQTRVHRRQVFFIGLWSLRFSIDLCT